MLKKFTKGLVGKKTVEGNLLESFSNEDIYTLLVRFRNEKNNYFKKYIQLFDKQLDLVNPADPLANKYEEEKQMAWQRHLAYEDLIQLCFKENSRRIKSI